MDKNIAAFFKQSDPLLASYLDFIDIPKVTKSSSYFSDLMDSIISQQLSIKAGATIFARFEALFPDKKITPEYLLTIPDDKIRAIGSSWSKVTYMKNIATAVVSGSLRIKRLDVMENEEVIAELTKVKGVGRWTAEMFLMFSLGREDVFSPGDLGLRRAIQKVYKLKKEPSARQLERITKKWIPYRTYACRILWKTLALPE